MFALAAALFAAALALVGKVGFDVWGRFRERRGVAAALAGEIGAFTRILIEGKVSANTRAITTLDPETRLRRLAVPIKVPQNLPVYDKLADKTGALPPDLAEDISAFYNAIASMRAWLGQLSSKEFLEADEAYQSGILNFLADGIDRYAGSQALRDRLRAVSRQSFWCFLGDC